MSIKESIEKIIKYKNDPSTIDPKIEDHNDTIRRSKFPMWDITAVPTIKKSNNQPLTKILTTPNNNKFPVEIFTDQILSNQVTLIKAGLGSGKSIEIIQYLQYSINKKLLLNKKIILIQPRTQNVISIAQRISNLITNSDDNVAYFTSNKQNQQKPHFPTNIEIYTEGFFLQKLSNPQFLANVHTIMFDEIHELTLELYQCLAFLLKGDKIPRLVLMSSTYNENKFIKYFEEFPSISSIVYVELPPHSPHTRTINFMTEEDSQKYTNYMDYIINKIDEILKLEQNTIINDIQSSSMPYAKDHILVFLPTIQKINEFSSKLNEFVLKQPKDSLIRNITTIPFYRDLEEKYRVFAEKVKIPTADPKFQNNLNNQVYKKIILSTDLAETGITFEGLKYVFDSGYRNAPYYDPYSNVQYTIIDLINKPKALQRWGRVGRLSPGIVYPVYTEETFRNDMDSGGITSMYDNTNSSLIPLEPHVSNITGMGNIYRQNLDKFMLKLIDYESSKSSKTNSYLEIKLLDPIPIQSAMRSIDNLFMAGIISTEGKPNKMITEKIKYSKFSILQSKLIETAISTNDSSLIYIIMIIVEMMNNKSTNKILSQTKTFNKLNKYNSDFINFWLLFKHLKNNLDTLSNEQKNYLSTIESDVDGQIENKSTPPTVSIDKNEINGNKNKIVNEQNQQILDSQIQHLKSHIYSVYKFNIIKKSFKEKELYISQQNNLPGIPNKSSMFKYPNLPQYLIYDNVSISTDNNNIKIYNFNILSSI